MRDGLRALARRAGREGLYHETITVAFMSIVLDRMRRASAAAGRECLRRRPSRNCRIVRCSRAGTARRRCSRPPRASASCWPTPSSARSHERGVDPARPRARRGAGAGGTRADRAAHREARVEGAQGAGRDARPESRRPGRGHRAARVRRRVRFSGDTLEKIADLKRVYGLDLDARASHRLVDAG